MFKLSDRGARANCARLFSFAHHLKIRQSLAAGTLYASGMLLLALAALVLVRHIQPAAVSLEARTAREFALRLRIEPAGEYLPYYSYAAASAVIPGGESFTVARFGLDNEATPSLAFLLDGDAGQIELRNLRLQTLFASYQWSAPEIAVLLKPFGRVTQYKIEKDFLAVRSRGKSASLRTAQDFSGRVAALQQTDNAILLCLGIGALGLLCLSKILRARHARPWRSSFERVQLGMRSADKRRVTVIALSVLFFAWGCFRVFAVTAQTPLVGYANTGDFFSAPGMLRLESGHPPRYL